MKNKIINISISVIATALLIGGIGAITKGFSEWNIRKEIKESIKEETYDYNSIAEFEQMYIEHIWAEDGNYHEDFREEIIELVETDPVDITSINIDETLKEYNVGIYDGTERYFFYLDKDIFLIKSLTNLFCFFALDESTYLNYDGTNFNLVEVEESERICKESIMKDTFLKYSAIVMFGFYDNVKSQEFRYKELNLPSKKMNGFIFSSYVEYSDYFDENNEPIWMDYEELGLISNLKINFENERIQLTSSQYESLFSHIGDYKLSEHQLTHIEVIEK